MMAGAGPFPRSRLKGPGPAIVKGSTTSSSRRTQAVKGVDSKSTGLCPRRFESCRLRPFACQPFLRGKSRTSLSRRESNPGHPRDRRVY